MYVCMYVYIYIYICIDTILFTFHFFLKYMKIAVAKTRARYGSTPCVEGRLAQRPSSPSHTCGPVAEQENGALRTPDIEGSSKA